MEDMLDTMKNLDQNTIGWKGGRWNSWFRSHIAFLLPILLFVACQPAPGIIKIDKAQLRNTLRKDVYQFNVDLWLDIKKENSHLGTSKIDIRVNGVDLGTAVIAADTKPMKKGKQKFGLRVAYPNHKLLLSTPNIVELNGSLVLNGKNHKLTFKDENVSVLNLTAM